jgi:hypothetical protein
MACRFLFLFHGFHSISFTRARFATCSLVYQDLITFDPVQVGGRGLQCPMPEELPQTVYGSTVPTVTGGSGGTNTTGVSGSGSGNTTSAVSATNQIVVPTFETVTVRLEHSMGDAPYVPFAFLSHVMRQNALIAGPTPGCVWLCFALHSLPAAPWWMRM